MPAKSERQRRLFGIALALKRGRITRKDLPGNLYNKVKHISELPEKKIVKYARKLKKIIEGE